MSNCIVETWLLASVRWLGTPQIASHTVVWVSFAPFVTEVGKTWKLAS